MNPRSDCSPNPTRQRTPTDDALIAKLSGRETRREFLRLVDEGWINPSLSMPAVMVRAVQLVRSDPVSYDALAAGQTEQLLVMAGQVEGMQRGLMVPPLVCSQLVGLASLPA